MKEEEEQRQREEKEREEEEQRQQALREQAEQLQSKQKELQLKGLNDTWQKVFKGNENLIKQYFLMKSARKSPHFNVGMDRACHP